MKKYRTGLLIAAALTGPLFGAYQYFSTHFVILPREDAMAMFMLIMACMGGTPT